MSENYWKEYLNPEKLDDYLTRIKDKYNASPVSKAVNAIVEPINGLIDAASKPVGSVLNIFKDYYSPSTGNSSNNNSSPVSKTPAENYVDIYNKLMSDPGFKFSKQKDLNTIKEELSTYPSFDYDINKDELYQQAVQDYTRRGELAMQDVMGRAAALTGGYGNSYAATAGSQAYLSALDELSRLAPEYYQLARDEHNEKKNALYDKYSMLMDEYNIEKDLYEDNYQKLLNDLGISGSMIPKEQEEEEEEAIPNYAWKDNVGANLTEEDRFFEKNSYSWRPEFVETQSFIELMLNDGRENNEIIAMLHDLMDEGYIEKKIYDHLIKKYNLKENKESEGSKG